MNKYIQIKDQDIVQRCIFEFQKYIFKYFLGKIEMSYLQRVVV